MIKIEKQLSCSGTFGQLPGYTPETGLFLDIETTGLSPAATTLCLIGAVTRNRDGRNWLLTQWLAESREEEPRILSEFLRFLEPYDTLIHFNGDTFDLPYLEEKLGQFHMENPIPKKKSLDLYRLFRPLKPLLGLARMDQRTLQTFLGEKRTDPLSGKALIPIWHQYADKRNPVLADMLLLHNQEDLSGLISLSDLCAYQSLLNGKFTVKSCRLRDDSAALTLRLEYPLPQNIQAAYPLRKKAAASRQNTSRKNLPASDSSSGSGPNDADWNPQTRFYVLNTDFSSASLEIPVFRGELLYFFPNYRDYYYLPLERQAIHRSVAAFVDRKHRTPAKPSNCCVRKTGVFLPQPSELVTPAFVPYYRSGERYFEYRENYENQPELLADYAKAVLKLFL